MKTVSFRGITNPMSVSEMKNVRGGEQKPVGPPETVYEVACKDLFAGAPCTMQTSGGSVTYICFECKGILRCGLPCYEET